MYMPEYFFSVLHAHFLQFTLQNVKKWNSWLGLTVLHLNKLTNREKQRESKCLCSSWLIGFYCCSLEKGLELSWVSRWRLIVPGWSSTVETSWSHLVWKLLGYLSHEVELCGCQTWKVNLLSFVQPVNQHWMLFNTSTDLDWRQDLSLNLTALQRRHGMNCTHHNCCRLKGTHSKFTNEGFYSL